MEKKEFKKCKKTLNILQIAATDKENLTSKINKKKMDLSNSNKIPKANGKRFKKNIDEHKSEIDVYNHINKMKTHNSSQAKAVVESDLIIDNPSENYWQNLAESRKKALDSALKENVDLHNKVNELEYENGRLKAMLEEAKTLVEVLSEMIEQNDDDSNGNLKEDSVLDREESSDTDLGETSFQSFG